MTLDVLMYRMSKPTRTTRMRAGAALVEFAVCMPVFFMITMACVETCRMLYVRQSLKVAAYECARLGIKQGITRDVLEDQCKVILVPRRIRNYTFSCEPADPSTLHYGDTFSVNIQTNMDDNSVVGTIFFRGRVFNEFVKIMAEY